MMERKEDNGLYNGFIVYKSSGIVYYDKTDKIEIVRNIENGLSEDISKIFWSDVQRTIPDLKKIAERFK